MQIKQTEITTPHFAFPFRFAGPNNAAVVNEQDTIDDIIDSVKVLLAYPIGSRADDPDFGIPDILFKQKAPEAVMALHDAILRHEPRADLVITEESTLDDYVRLFKAVFTARGDG